MESGPLEQGADDAILHSRGVVQSVVQVAVCKGRLPIDTSHQSVAVPITGHLNIQEGECPFHLLVHHVLISGSNTVEML